MHNGDLQGWKHYKRRFAESLADRWYLEVKGGCDSEWSFALFLDTLERMGYDPGSCTGKGFGPTVLRQAVVKTIARINAFVAKLPEQVLRDDHPSWLNFAVTDGHSIICTRYVGSRTEEAPSLYYSSGTTWQDKGGKGEYQMDRRDKGADIILVASEPLTFERGKPTLSGYNFLANIRSESWVTVPTNSVLTIHKQTVMVHPIIDENYSYSSLHHRSPKFVREQGLLNDAFASGTMTPAISDGNNPKRQLGH